MYNYCKICCHDDGDIGFCDKCYYNHILEEKGIPPTEYEVKPKQTNADRIRSMTDEELAHFFYNLDSTIIAKDLPPYIAPSKEEWLDWLKQEVK